MNTTKFTWVCAFSFIFFNKHSFGIFKISYGSQLAVVSNEMLYSFLSPHRVIGIYPFPATRFYSLHFQNIHYV